MSSSRPEVALSRRSFGLGLTAGVAAAGCAASAPAPPAAHTPKSPTPASAPPAALARKPSAAPVLRALLAENRSKDPVYSGHFSNHMSMALTALFEMGADADRLHAFATARASRVEPLRPVAPLASEDFRACMGVPTALVGLIGLFERQLAAQGREQVLRAALPELVPSVSGALFHGLIRTAYALEAEDDTELAHALAYFTTVAAPVHPSARAQGAQSAQAPRTLDEVAAIALRLYLGSRNFSTLHAITGTHALRLLLPYFAEPELAVSWQFQAVMAAGAGVEVAEPKARELPAWPRLISSALASDDEHDIKLVYTCHQEAQLRDSLAYQHVAALRLPYG